MMPHVVRYGTPEHSKVLREIQARVQMVERDMGSHYSLWREQERQFVSYLPEKDVDKARRTAMETTGEPELTTVVVPYSYSMLMTAHTYWTSVLLGRSPVFQFAGRHGEAEMNVLSVEAIHDYQVQVGRMMAPLYIWLMDVGTFGLGVIGSYWDREVRHVSEYVKQQTMLGDVPIGEPQYVRKLLEIPGYEGNRIFNIRPYDYLPDTRVPLGQPQSGEFNGRRLRLSWTDILARQAQGVYFNIEELERHRRTGIRHGGVVSSLSLPESFAATPKDNSTGPIDSTTDMGIVDLVEMCIKIIPKEWSIDGSTYPEKWMFTVADDCVVIGMQPLGLYSDEFPVDVLEYEIDGYRSIKRSMLEISRPMNEIMTWLFNSHFASVRENINGNWIYDPSKVYTKDILERKPGKRIRLRPEAMGADVRSVVTQLQTLDPTMNHLRDAQGVADLAQRVVGVMDTLMGSMPSGRKTATESRQAEAGSISRQRTLVEYFSSTGFYSLANKLLSNTQQMYTDPKYFRIVGDTFDPATSKRLVSPADIAGNYDYLVVDGTMPMDRYGTVTMWTQLLTQMGQTPQVLAQYDVGGIFSWVAQLAGLRNIKRFRVQSMPDATVQKQVQAGNLVSPREAALGPPAPNQQLGGPRP